MRRSMTAASAAAALFMVTVPSGLDAQDQGGWWEWALAQVAGGEVVRTGRGDVRIPSPDWGWGDGREREDDRERARREGRRAPEGWTPYDGPGRVDARGRGRGKARGNGPPFCRSGAGHPVHGRRWCVEKGFGLGPEAAWRWERRGWDDVLLDPARGRPGAVLDGRDLAAVLGRVVFGRLEGERRRRHAPGPLEGRWLRRGGPAVLQLRAGGLPFAELTDLDRDGQADVVLLAAY